VERSLDNPNYRTQRIEITSEIDEPNEELDSNNESPEPATNQTNLRTPI
jgi:hypothetical protein